MKLKLQTKQIKKCKLQSTITFDKNQGMRFCKTKYYKAQAKNIKAYEFIEKEKTRLSTIKTSKVTELIEMYKSLGENNWKSKPGRILYGIYEKNKKAAILYKKNKTETNIINSNLLSIISRPETLLLAYKNIKGNKGAMTLGAEISNETLNQYTPEQKEIYLKSLNFPDKFNLYDVIKVSALLKKGMYPWGSSSRVYVPKPGVTDKKRPITIPPFLDIVVQKAISMVLESVYEPYFEIQNRSFGFRPNKSIHDAIVAVTSTYTSGKITAIKGDIEAAYDTVNKDKLLFILEKKIKDRKFLQLIKERLDYDFVETNEKGNQIRIRPPKGIPQGGIDSPYLFNIYMKELDDFIHTEIAGFVEGLNQKYNGKRNFKKLYNYIYYIQANREKLNRQRILLKNKIKKSTDETEIPKLRTDLFQNIKNTRLLRHKSNYIKTEHPHRRNISILYTRYAHDWILLTNGNKQIAGTIKTKISNFLMENLELRLSDKKTTITDIRNTPAKFRGFELKHPKIGPMIKKPVNLYFSKGKRYNLQRQQRQQGSTIIWATVDKQRLINRLHMKGFCDKNGFPRELPWLSCMEPQVIIERYNAVIRGLAELYYGFIRNNSYLQRWIHILRFSCLKTLAQKYRTTIKGIFKKFGYKKDNTVQVKVIIKVKEILYEKNCTLWNYKTLMQEIKKNNNRKKEVLNNFWKIELLQ